MRWLFLLLLTVNIIFFSWNWIAERGTGSSYPQEFAHSPKGKKLVLLHEIESTAAGKPAVDERLLMTPEGGFCYVLGPFISSTEVARAAARTSTISAIVERRWGRMRQSSGYWVYIPSVTSGGARNILRGLFAAGIGDARLGNSTKMKHAVSLGVFPDLEKARKRLLEVKKHGFDVAINKAQIRKRQYWLALRGNEGQRLPKNRLDSLIENTQEAKVEQRPCAGVEQ